MIKLIFRDLYTPKNYLILNNFLASPTTRQALVFLEERPSFCYCSAYGYRNS
jgi:hypothetical protein